LLVFTSRQRVLYLSFNLELEAVSGLEIVLELMLQLIKKPAAVKELRLPQIMIRRCFGTLVGFVERSPEF